MSDLIERLRFCANLHPQVGCPENGKLFAEAATALAEAAATIARQQVMLDRALEASFDDKARADRAEEEIARLREALADLEDEIDNSAIEFERPTFVEVCEGIIRAALTPKP